MTRFYTRPQAGIIFMQTRNGVLPLFVKNVNVVVFSKRRVKVC